MKAVEIVFLSLLSCASQVTAQSLQFLNTPPSIDASSMGGIAGSLPSDNALAILGNPAQAGLFSLHGIAATGTYLTSKPFAGRWWMSEESTSSFAAEMGLDLTKYLKSPYKVSVGLGFSSLSSKLASSLDWEENSREDNLTVGFALRDKVDLALGLNLKWISNTQQLGVGNQNQSAIAMAADYGLIVRIPILRVPHVSGVDQSEGRSRIKPIINLGIAAAARNVGGYLAYNPSYSVILPRQAVLGLNLELGLQSSFDGRPWKLVSIVLAREADEPLTHLDSTLVVQHVNANQVDSLYDWYYAYTSFPKYFNPYANFIQGNSRGTVGIRTGGQVQVGEAFFIRFGATAGSYLDGVPTFGYGVRSKGLLRLVYFLGGSSHPSSALMSFIINHLDIQYDSSEIEYESGKARWFNELNLVVD